MPDERVHPSARGFDVAAPAYDRGRPGYPAAAIEWLCARLGIAPGRIVLDLAAGTGKLTRPLAATGAELVAVEPARGMRESLHASLPGVPVLDGTAESIPLPDASVDAVAVGQAFHWFDAAAALAEIGRVLRPGGGVGLVWNTRDRSDPLQMAVTATIEPLRGETPWWERFDGRAALGASDRFGEVDELRVAHRQELDPDGFVERFVSVSFVAAAPAAVRARVERELRALAARSPLPIVVRYETEAYVAFRR